MPFPETNQALSSALAKRGYEEPTVVQEAVMAPETRGRDLLVSAQTGSGKTVAYGLAFAETLMGGETRFPQVETPLALIIAPTRELAMQVQRELQWLYAETGARIVSCIGGMDARAEAKTLANGPHIVVGTPGRLCDHLQRGRLDLTQLKVMVLDEADEMLDLGFKDELEMLLKATPPSRRTLLFSATIARDIAALAKQYQHDALRIDTLVRNQPHADIEYRAVRVNPMEIEHAVVNLLRYFEAPTALVFCARRKEVRHLQSALTERGFTTVALSGELSQNERTHALQSMRDGHARVCVCTDVAARGIDLPDLSLVIHATLPTNSETLLHRSGRTGRAGRKGTSVLVVPGNRGRKADQLLFGAGITAEWSGAPGVEAIRKRDAERLLQDPILQGDVDGEEQELVKSLTEGRSPEQLAAALVRLYQGRLPAPEELSGLGQPDPRRNERRDVSSRDAPANDAEAPRERPQRLRDSAWFAMNVGRRNKADPRWLVPLICRIGGITKQDIGDIRILDHETRFELNPAVAAKFTAAIPEPGADEVQIRSIPGPSAPQERADRAAPGHGAPGQHTPQRKPHRKGKDVRDKPRKKKAGRA